MSHFLKEMPEQILMRYQVKGMIALLLSYVIWVTYANTTWGPPTAQFIILRNGAAIYWLEKGEGGWLGVSVNEVIYFISLGLHKKALVSCGDHGLLS